MPKTLVITMQQEYPFFKVRSQYPVHNGPIFVRRILKTNEQNCASMQGKATFIKNLRNKNLIKVENLVEEEHQIHVFYENVQSKYDWRDPNIITDVYNQLKNFTTYLTNIGVKAHLKSSRIGVTDKVVLKYYLGIDFEWDMQKDEQSLPSFYESQLKKMFGNQFVIKTNNLQMNQINFKNCSPSHREKTTKQSKQNAQRKVSFATLPSRQDRIDRMANIEKEMNLFKNAYQKHSPNRKQSSAGFDTQRYNQNQNSQPNLKNPAYKGALLRDKNKLSKKLEDRKFSGDIKNNMLSMKKLQQKQSDIKSQRGVYVTANKLKERQCRQNNIEQIQTLNSKSRMEQMKYQQYIHIKKSQKNYLQEFISVLEDQPPMFSNQISHNTSKGTNPTQNSSKAEQTNALSLTTQTLRLMTLQAILNSRKIISKVKANTKY